MENSGNLFRESVRERDLDNFMVEELSASADFLTWVLDKLPTTFAAPSDLEMRVRKSPPRESDTRQTDVQIGWFDGPDIQACVLIENKVTDGFQADQAQSYAGEVSALRAKLGLHAATAILVAPENKMPALRHDGAFDAEISIEKIIEFLSDRIKNIEEGELRTRIEVRIELLEALCGKRRSGGWVAKTIQEKRDFAERYMALSSKILPNLKVRPSSDGKKATTRIYEKLNIPGLDGPTLRHEFGKREVWKYANVQFSGKAGRVQAFRDSGLLDNTPYNVAKAGESLAIRVITPGVDPMRPFGEQQTLVEDGLIAIRDLVSWLNSNRSRIAVIIGQDD